MRLLTATIALIAVSACSPPQKTVTIEFEARLGNEPIDCETAVDGVAMTDLRFYVMGPVLVFGPRADGSSELLGALEIPENGRWQQEGLALIDLENGQGACRNGTSETNALLEITAPSGEYDRISFVVGVPFERNHADPLAAAPPLDDSTMHWHWRSGYKFLRAGFETDDDGFWMHIGSAACEGTVQNITGCQFGNRTSVDFYGYQMGDTIVFDFAPLVAAIDTSDAEPTDCSSGPGEASCAEPFRLLGLSEPGPASSGPQAQILFRAESP